jgi:YebC/PmpR family DNA-binding regulatory protein
MDNIKRAIQKGTGELPGVAYENQMYEGYGPGGTAVMIEMLTDNKNRAIAELRHVFSRKGGTIGENGCVSWMFNKKGVVKATGNLSEDALLEALIDFNIDDISKEEDLCIVTCDLKDLEAVKTKTAESGMKIEGAEIEWVAKNKMEIAPDDEEKVMDFLSAIDELDDVQNVYSNAA